MEFLIQEEKELESALPKYKDASTQTEHNECNCKKALSKDVASQINTEWFTISDYIKTDKILRTLTGLPTMSVLF